MSYADKVFIDMCRDIIENGTSTEGEKVRPRWEDGTPAYTIKKFGVVNRYDLSKEFPAPKFWLNPEVKDFYDFTPDDVKLEGYETHPQIKNIPIAV